MRHEMLHLLRFSPSLTTFGRFQPQCASPAARSQELA
jgi:hypothetical protein